jgi:hypothetical protein
MILLKGRMSGLYHLGASGATHRTGLWNAFAFQCSNSSALAGLRYFRFPRRTAQAIAFAHIPVIAAVTVRRAGVTFFFHRPLAGRFYSAPLRFTTRYGLPPGCKAAFS